MGEKRVDRVVAWAHMDRLRRRKELARRDDPPKEHVVAHHHDRSFYREQIIYLAHECDMDWLVRQETRGIGGLRGLDKKGLADLLFKLEREIECRQNGVDSDQYRPILLGRSLAR
jgi:hypothetical protein